MIQSMDKELHKYWGLLDSSQKKSIISMIRAFIGPAANKTRTTVEQYNKEIDEAMDRMDAGDFVTHEQILKEMAKW
jgi:hypothetical protein